MGVSSKNNIGAKVKGAWLGYIWMLSYTIENEFDWKDQYGDSWWITRLQKKTSFLCCPLHHGQVTTVIKDSNK